MVRKGWQGLKLGEGFRVSLPRQVVEERSPGRLQLALALRLVEGELGCSEG